MSLSTIDDAQSLEDLISPGPTSRRTCHFVPSCSGQILYQILSVVELAGSFEPCLCRNSRFLLVSRCQHLSGKLPLDHEVCSLSTIALKHKAMQDISSSLSSMRGGGRRAGGTRGVDVGECIGVCAGLFVDQLRDERVSSESTRLLARSNSMGTGFRAAASSSGRFHCPFLMEISVTGLLRPRTGVFRLTAPELH